MSGVWKQRISDEDNNIPGGRKLGPGPDIRLSEELELDNMRTDNCELTLNIVMRMWGMLTLWHRDMGGERRGCDVTGPVISWTSALHWHLVTSPSGHWLDLSGSPGPKSRHHLSFLNSPSFPIFKQDIVFSKTFDLWIKTSHITSYTLDSSQDMTKG